MAARVQGKNVTLLIHSQALLLPIPLGELDKFEAKSNTTIIKSRPVSYTLEGATHKYGGYNLSFETTKVDWKLARFHYYQDQKLRGAQLAPNFYISETLTLFNGSIEQYFYKNVSIFEFELSIAEEYEQKFNGFSPNKEQGIIDTTLINDPINAAILKGIFLYGNNKNILEGAIDLTRKYIENN